MCLNWGSPQILLTPNPVNYVSKKLLSELREKFPSVKVLLLAGLPNGDAEEKARNMDAHMI